MGPGAAAARCRAALRAPGADALLSFGLAGGLDPQLCPGRVCLPSEVVALTGTVLALRPARLACRRCRGAGGALCRSTRRAACSAAEQPVTHRYAGDKARAVSLTAARGCRYGKRRRRRRWRRCARTAVHRHARDRRRRGDAAARGARGSRPARRARLAWRLFARCCAAPAQLRPLLRLARAIGPPAVRWRPSRGAGGAARGQRRRCMRALVTGATGFVGAAVARALLAAGLAGARAGAPELGSPQSRRARARDCALGDLADRGSLERALAGCAGAVSRRGRLPALGRARPGQLLSHQRRGHAQYAAGRARGRRRSASSTPAASPRIGLALPTARPGTRATPVALADMIGHYKRSKFLAEQVVREARAAGCRW